MPLQSQQLISPASISGSLDEALREAMTTGGVENVLVTRADGLPIAHNFPDSARARHAAAMSAAVVGAARMATHDLRRGGLKGVSIDAEEGQIVCLQAGDQAIVAGLAPAGGNVGLVLLTLRRLANQVATIIGTWETEHPAPPRPLTWTSEGAARREGVQPP